MAFINLRHVDTNFDKTSAGKGAPIKCPICGNDFLVGADDSQSHGWPYLIHAPRVVSEDYIERAEFTCPFLLKPIPLDYTCPALNKDSLNSYIGAMAMANVIDDDVHAAGDNVASPIELLRELIKQYSRMMQLQGTTCSYCNGTYELIYRVPKDAGGFSFSFGCKCITSVGKPDLIRLAYDFMYKYDKKMPERNKRADFLNAVISRMPAGAIKEN